MLDKKTKPEDKMYDADKIYKIGIEDISKKSYSFLLNKDFILPYVQNPKENILNQLNKADSFFDSLFKVILETPEQSHRFFFSYPPKNSCIFVLLDDYIYNLYGVRNSDIFDDDEKTIGILKFQFDLYKKNREEKNYSNIANNRVQIEEKILHFFEYSGFDYDKEIYTLKNLQLIHLYFSKNSLSEVEYMFYYCIYGYILSVIITSNIAPDVPCISYFDALKEVYEDDRIIFFGAFLNHVLYCGNGLKRFDGAFEIFERRKLKATFGDTYSLGDIELFQNSVIYKEYYTQGKIQNPKILPIILDNPDIFLAFKSIPYKKVFDLLITLEENELIEKIATLLQERKGLKVKERILLFLIQNTISTNHIITQEKLTLSIQYLDTGMDNSKILSLPNELLQKVAEYDGNKKKLLGELLENPNYLEDIEKSKIIDALLFDLDFLEDSSDGKDELLHIIEQSKDLSVDDLKIKFLSTYIQFGLDEKIAFHKKIFRNSKENIAQKIEFLQLLLLTSVGSLYRKDEIISHIFTLSFEDIQFITNIFSRLILPEHITLKNFIELLDILLQKKKYISQIVKTKENITIEQLQDILDSKKIKSNIIESIQEIFHKENYELVRDILELESESMNIEQVYMVIEIGKKLSKDLKEDFLLDLDNFSLEQLKNMNEGINLYKFFRLNITHFHECLLVKNSPEKIRVLKKLIPNSTLDSIKNLGEFKDMVQLYLIDGNIIPIQVYISNLTKEVKTYHPENEFDNSIIGIYNHGTDREKQDFVIKIDLMIVNLIRDMHPSQTTSTSNYHFGPGSGSYSEVILNYFLRKLLKASTETSDDYLKRILSLNFSESLNISSLSDINGGGEVRNLYNACNTIPGHRILIDYLYQIETLIGNITGEANIDLNELQKYYSNLLKKELRKLKRSLGI